VRLAKKKLNIKPFIMKQKFIFLIALFSMLQSAVFSQDDKKTQSVFTTLYSDYAISAITVADNIDVVLIQGSEEDVTLRAIVNTFSRLDMNVEGETLVISPKAGLLKNERVALFITVSDLKRLTLTGNAFATTRGKLTSKSLLVTIRDNAKLQLGSNGKVVVDTPDNYQVLRERQYVSASAISKI
jgi:hypothetical protein